MKRLSSLSGETQRAVTRVVNKLEQLSGYMSEDVRFLAEHETKQREKIKQLGLDADDTTAEELYHTLLARFAKDGQELSKATGYDRLNRAERAQKIASLAKDVQPDCRVLAIKKSRAKSLLRDNPPRHLMKKLNYRSLDSMLKREDPSRLMAVAPFSEPDAWSRRHISSIRALKASDFEQRDISYIAATENKWESFSKLAMPINYSPVMAAVLVWPVKALDEAASVTYVLLALQAAEILETDSIYLKSHLFQKDFGRLAANLYESGEQVELGVAGQRFFDWQSLKQLFHPEIDAMAAFSGLHPALKWWSEARHAAVLGGESVSMHLGDIISGYLHGSDFDSRHLFNAMTEIKSSLFGRYLKYEGARNHFLGQLDMTEYSLEQDDEQSIASDLETGLI